MSDCLIDVYIQDSKTSNNSNFGILSECSIDTFTVNYFGIKIRYNGKIQPNNIKKK